MKLFHLLSIPNLAASVQSTDFVYNEKYVKPGSLLMPMQKRFPPQKDMPIAHPALSRDASAERNYKFVSEMSWMDKQLLMIAYRHAMAEDVKKYRNREDVRIDEGKRRADQHAIETEVFNQRFSIMRGWMRRFSREKMFHDLKVHSMDELKQMMRLIHHKTDENLVHMDKLLLQQFNLAPGQGLTPAQIDKMTDKQEDLIRFKINLQHEQVIKIDEMQRRVAEQAASLAMVGIEQNHTQLLQKLAPQPGQYDPFTKKFNKVS